MAKKLPTKTGAIKDGLTCIGIATTEGQFAAYYSEHGLARLDFPGAGEISGSKNVPAVVQAWHAITTRAVKDVVAGKVPAKLPPLDLSTGTVFQQKVWKVLSEIKGGCTLSYGEVAEAVGKPGAARAVGRACGANPIPVLIPCHRVLAANRILGGFSGGLEWKRKLLSRENISVQ